MRTLLLRLVVLAGATGAAGPSLLAAQVILVPAATGNEARYRVREQLLRLSFPSDAVGRTDAVSGSLTIAADGTVDPIGSRFTIDLTTLATDNARRDNYVRRNTLATDSFPHITFVPATAAGLPSPLPSGGTHTFQLAGDLTVRGTTRRATWHVFAQFSDSTVTGHASTRFTFADYGLPIPRVGSVLSVEDDIRLEYEFTLVRRAPRD